MNKSMRHNLLHVTALLFVSFSQAEGNIRTTRHSALQTRSADLNIGTVATEAQEAKTTTSIFDLDPTHPTEKTLSEHKDTLHPETQTLPVVRSRKPWTLLVYMAANNNLHTFALQNLREMTRVGSNDNINVVVQFDGIGDRSIKRYLIENNNTRLISELSAEINSISGTPQSLYQFIKWGYQTFPAEHLAIDLWNHGSGIKDPSIWGKVLMRRRDDFFNLNSNTKMFELDRRLDLNSNNNENELSEDTRNLFSELTLAILRDRGIAFNDSEEVYIDNQQLRAVLDNVCRYVLIDKKIDVVFMDACHMGMVELASKLRHFANYMVASAEVEPGRGYNYEYLLLPFSQSALTPRAFALHGVRAYEKEYRSSHADYTQAAVELSSFLEVEKTLTNLGKTLNDGLNKTESRRIFDLLKVTRLSSKYTTEFYDPDYIDAGHFLASIMKKSAEILATHTSSLDAEQRTILETIKTQSELTYGALTTSIIAETHGNNLSMSHGLGLFFPKRNIHLSYLNCSFDKKTAWSTFLARFLNRLRSERNALQESAA